MREKWIAIRIEWLWQRILLLRRLGMLFLPQNGTTALHCRLSRRITALGLRADRLAAAHAKLTSARRREYNDREKISN